MTAVPPRPAAPDDCTCGHFGLSANFHLTPCPIKVAHLARLAQERAAPDTTAGDGLRDDAWWTRVFLAVQELVDSVPYADGSKYPVPHAAARDAERIQAVRKLHSPVEWQEETEPGSGELEPDKPLQPFCRECTDDEYVSAIEFGDTIDLGADVTYWPCATIHALDPS